jgi:hypothetical protein
MSCQPGQEFLLSPVLEEQNESKVGSKGKKSPMEQIAFAHFWSKHFN